MNFVHRSLLTASGGRIGRTMGNMAVYKVTSKGRASGQARTVMLTAPVRDGDTVVFVASKRGDDRAAEIDAEYAAAYSTHPLDEPNGWGDLESFRTATAQ